MPPPIRARPAGRSPSTALNTHQKRLFDDLPGVYPCPVVLAEFTWKTLGRHGEEATRRYTESILEKCAVIDQTETIGIDGGRIHAKMKQERPTFGMTDALTLASARDRGVKVLTGDPRFARRDDALLLEGNP